MALVFLILLLTLLLLTETVLAQDPDTHRTLDVCNCPGKTTGPIKEEWPVYGPDQSLMGVARRWDPTVFYPLDPTFRRWMNKYDRQILENKKSLDSFLLERKFTRVVVSDTVFKPYTDKKKP